MQASRWLVLVLVTSFAWTLAPAADAAQKAKSAPKSQVKKSAPKKSVAKKTVKKAPVKKAPVKVVKKPLPKTDPLNLPMVGTWYTLDATGQFAKANKFVFTNAGEFNYIGPGWKSGGTFTLREGVVTLSWLQIDGNPVKPGTVKKQIPLGEKAFQIERFTYGKATP